jgi:DNA repair protein RecN (Recombination protein N)
MLLELRVENLGIVADLLVPFGSGMTVITGETGAGKTLLIDALELLCGGRADPTVVREGATEARVEGRFAVGDDEVVLARVVPASGRSRGYVNGGLVTAGELAEWGRRLVDLHGQHTHQSLLQPAEQRTLLDRFAGPSALDARTRVAGARDRARRLAAELGSLGGDARTRAREVDLLRYQLAEIEGAELVDAGEDDRLRAEEELLGDAEAHRAALDAAYGALEGAAADALGAAVAALAGRAPFVAIAERLRGLQGEVADAAHDVRLARDDVVADPERLAAVQARRARLGDLLRKYGPGLDDVLRFAAEARGRLADLEQHDARAAALVAAADEARGEATEAARALTRLRRRAARGLGDAVAGRLRALAMARAVFTVDVTPAELADDGADEVTFRFSANAGEPARPLARVASGGELSRAMLALRMVLSEAPPTLVFDEVDAGIGGEAGVAVGRALAALGGTHQVLCVTHLAQVAAFGDAHVVVTKGERSGRTVAAAALLLDDARVGELSRMLAGDGDSRAARAHARELLERAAARRAGAATR